MAAPQQGDAPPDACALRHELRTHVGRSMQCWSCKRMGPSPQTGDSECIWCRMCKRCCKHSKMCIVSGLLSAGDECEDEVVWSVGNGLAVLQIADSPGMVEFAAGLQEMNFTTASRVVYDASGSPPSLLFGDAHRKYMGSLQLPRERKEVAQLLIDIVLLLNRAGVSHQVPWFVDEASAPLPRGIPASGGTAPVVACVAIPGKQMVLTCGADRTVSLVHTGSVARTGAGVGGTKASRTPLPGARVRWARQIDQEGATLPPLQQHIDVSPCRRYAVVCGSPSQLLRTSTGERVTRLYTDAGDPTATGHAAVYSACGRYIALAMAEQVAIFRGDNGELITRLDSPDVQEYNAGGRCLAFSTSGGYLALSADIPNADGGPSTSPAVLLVSAWRPLAGGTLTYTPLADARQTQPVCSVRFCADDSELLVASTDGVVVTYAVGGAAGVKPRRVFRHPVAPGVALRAACYTGYGQHTYIVTLTGDGTVWHWGPGKHAAPITHQAVGGDGRALSLDVTLNGMCFVGTEGGEVWLNGTPPKCVAGSGDEDVVAYPERRAVSEQGGQLGLLVFLNHQRLMKERAAASNLPQGTGLLRQLPEADLKRIAGFLPSPTLGDATADDQNCSVM